jgi:F-type H+-transporting ATPase subunit epsilon
MATFQLSILTPERTVFEGPVEYVEVPGTEGYLGVLAHHAALVTGMAPGRLTVRREGGAVETWQVSGGFFEVSNNQASVLADRIDTEAPPAARRPH